MSSARSLVLLALSTFVCCEISCSSSTSIGRGTAQVFIVPEDSIVNGIQAGTENDNIQDGWTVTYSKFIVTIGSFRARSTQTGEALASHDLLVLDLKAAPAGGYVVANFLDIPATRFDKVGEDMPAASGTVRAFAAAIDVKRMVDNRYAIYFEGSMSKPDGQSCKPSDPASCKRAGTVADAIPTIRFRWGFAMGTSFDDCASAQGDTGFVVPAGGAAQIKPTIHGDHWFFTDVTEGAEITKRYAQFVADCDLDSDGETTLDELKRVKSSDVFPIPKYRLSGGVGSVPVATAYDYVKTQARTIHDFQGDGECPTRRILE